MKNSTFIFWCARMLLNPRSTLIFTIIFKRYNRAVLIVVVILDSTHKFDETFEAQSKSMWHVDNDVRCILGLIEFIEDVSIAKLKSLFGFLILFRPWNTNRSQIFVSQKDRQLCVKSLQINCGIILQFKLLGIVFFKVFCHLKIRQWNLIEKLLLLPLDLTQEVVNNHVETILGSKSLYYFLNGLHASQKWWDSELDV